MKKVTDRHFKTFKKWCEHYRTIFNLRNWKVYYKRGVSGEQEQFAQTGTDLGGYVATIWLCNEWPEEVELNENELKIIARHEMLHVLFARFKENAYARHATKDELAESEEEVVRVLVGLLK